jgi:acyl-CoA reductase-like NAD-dependent aldehyde dehydrogenase
MRELRSWLIRNRRRVAETMMAEGGKPIEDALLEIMYVASALGFWAKQGPRYLRDERIRSRSPLLFGRRVIVRHEPHGVVGVIGPWNYPLVLGVGDSIPALVAGNTVVLKPSELTPLSSKLVVEEGMREAGLPAAACQIATGAGETGAALVDSVDIIMFKGSTKTGRRIGARAAERLIPASLELGGKDAMIVLKDANVERAANAAVLWGLHNSGQTCMAVERVYVEEPVYEDFVRRTVDKTGKLRQGPPGEMGSVEIGALISPAQIEIIERHVADAVERGARVLCGGRRRGGEGRFFEPTVLVDVDHSMACMHEETFGPTLPIVKVEDAEQAVRHANDSDFGLNSSVFTRDLDKGVRIAGQIEAGNSCINDTVMNYMELKAPFAGWKDSGVGSRHGADGIRKYCKQKTILVTRFALDRDLTMYPSRRWETILLDRALPLLYGRGRQRPRR